MFEIPKNNYKKMDRVSPTPKKFSLITLKLGPYIGTQDSRP